MGTSHRSLAVAFAALAATLLLAGDLHAQLRTAPDIQTPENYQPGTGVNRLGIMSNNSRQRRTTNYVVPGGGYFYGWSPGRYFFSDGYYYDDYYYVDRYLCPYCGSRWCDGGCRYPGPLVYPPIVGDAGALYGPRATRQFLGIDGNNNAAAVGGGAPPLNVAAARAPDVPPPISNPTVRARAWKFVEYGDRHFQRGDYRKAAERYRKAESQAADIPDIYFRQGFANLGAERYADAVVAMRKGLALNPDWPNSGFVLEELYPSAEAKRDVFRQLHTYVHEHPNDADAQFLLAVMQHFDGQTEAAEVRFRRVVELAGQAAHARLFLPLAPADNQADDPPANDDPLLPR